MQIGKRNILNGDEEISPAKGLLSLLQYSQADYRCDPYNPLRSVAADNPCDKYQLRKKHLQKYQSGLT